MNSLWIGAISLLLFFLGYKFYGRIAERLWQIDPERKTPAIEREDGIDYVPAKNWLILFGHHFASIAGAGPIIGPVIACAIWGWLPAVIWIVLGSIFLGGIHDFSSLFISIRHGGKSIGDIAESVVNYRTKIIFSLFLWLSLILVVTVFAAVGAQTLAAQPKIVVPTFGLIFDAILLSLMIYKWNLNQVVSTVIGVLILFGLIILGYYFPLSIPGGARNWIKILLLYAFIASIIPVNILLQPRDYLSAFILFFGLFFGYLGLILTHPVIHTPAYIAWKGTGGALWPMLGVIIACGAISGFHSLIASGTTAKQLSNEKDARKIGYGAMIAEGVLAVLAVLAVSAGLYWSKASGHLNLIYPEIIKNEGWIVAFGKGYGELIKPIFGVLGALIGMIMLNAFVVTTLDSATRITRYISEELFGEGLRIKLFRNRYLSTLVIVALAGWLALGNWQAIWPVFGAANQLVAALVLLIISLYLLIKNKPTRYTLIPGLFMLATTILALVYEANTFFRSGKLLLGVVAIILLILTFFIVGESISVICKKRKVMV
ncbi:MAG: carbon starvation protein A [bacterium (Candidatus Ratteibacteria) CG_4_10_14_3_um_filter_41_18]|uniref:Carbon starvation protein A n=4 Tax=Candidatus Ratteibacteria TaxID=2979319 RepID=A0A2M7E8R5_9BACT|nr:MAG: carbon starvation protein A [bacterium (Candidatus Ratteibacteria) CG01_land_8_20_14_3_00_40_19]PIW33151.1 MAG: carbon starvation protein A [bacterium (Candidatus Ratteibacteria) CG15_BIG_FIL_POST_REV_8_21_14_020_41_12]PIX77109.1 MAG: carbon starvation protein A [bacterium (Candidatus Ratteibacteria) CG_4_10_14_3_um_filter_41_18]PJA61172.1 MAG: carbon starvation protein A [bacterium (Candidatus Ratteibacteria) CG_4_9_14_3_um_filter_41_21]HCG76996.1 carbon starvation protein A [bacterium